jgi:GAF domain-containing protein/DNA-binding response OmpR family regulator
MSEQSKNRVVSPTTRVDDSNYLDRVIWVIVPIISIVVIIFAAIIIWRVSSLAWNQAVTEHNSGLARLESAIQNELEQYTANLRSLAADPNLLSVLKLNLTNVDFASERAAELINLHNDEYLAVEFIRINSEAGINEVVFERLNQNGQASDVIINPHPYEILTRDIVVFENATNGITREPVIGNFRTLKTQPGRIDPSLTILLDSYVPVYIEDTATPVMVIHLLINAQNLRSIVNLATGNLIDEQSGRHAILVDNRGRIIADSDAFRDIYIRNLDALGGNVAGDAFYEALFEIKGLARNTDAPLVDFGKNGLYSHRQVNSASLGTLSWDIYIVDAASLFFAPDIVFNVLVGVLAIIIPIVLVWLLKNFLHPILNPIHEATELIQTTLSEMDVPLSSTEEHTILLSSVRRVATRIDRLSTDLNKQLKRHTRDLQVAGLIGRETATLSDLDDLAKRSINLICNELGFYHAQIFLLDVSGTVAVLRFSRGEAGEKMIAQHHQLRVGSESIIGKVTATKQPVIINNTMSESGEKHGFNPLLPDTRAEMGLPLIIGDTVIGALDIQSRRIDVFFEEDIATYQLLADQLAVAIYNAQLREQTDSRIGQIDRLNRQLTRDAWQEVESKLSLRSHYGSDAVKGNLTSSITIRGEKIGRLEADLPEGMSFSESDKVILESVAERLALAIENARLFQETQVSLAETSTLYQLSRQLNEANLLEDVLQAIIVTVAITASGGQVWLFEDTLPGEKPDWAIIAVDLPIMPRVGHMTLVGQHIQISQYPALQDLSPIEPHYMENLAALANMREDLRSLFLAVNTGAIAFIPLNIRGEWKGFISIEFSQARHFSERERRVFSALIAQAGVAIDNRLLLQQTEDALARQEKLYAASRIINTSQSLSDLVFAAVATASEPFIDFWLGLLEGDTDSSGWPNQVRIVAQSEHGEVQETHLTHPLHLSEESPIYHRDPEIFSNLAECEDLPDFALWVQEQGYQYMGLFPLYSDNTPIALFYIVSKNSFELSLIDYEVYKALTGQMSIQIQNRNLLERTEETLQEIRRLYVASRAISSASNIEAIYDAVAGHLAMPFIQQSVRLDEELNISMTLLLAQPEPSVHAPQLRYEYQWHSDPTRTIPIRVGTVISQEDAPFGILISENDDSSLIYRHMEEVRTDFPMLREILAQNMATSAAVAPLWSRQRWFGVLILRTDNPSLLDESYLRFMQSIADQIAIAIENQTLLAETEFERQRLNEILATLPTGILVLDSDTLYPIQANELVTELLGQPLRMDEPFTAEIYNIHRTGTNLYYPNEELPIYTARAQGREVPPADDVAIIHELGYQIDLMISAAPIFNAQGQQEAIVAAFQNISTLRSMENTMQENLRETVLLYETQRSLNEAESLEELLDGLIAQLAMQQPTDAHIILARRNDEFEVVRSLIQPMENAGALASILRDNLVNINDVQHDMSLDDEASVKLNELGARSLLVIPLSVRTRPRPLGWMMIMDTEPESFTSDQERVMSSVSDMASQAIDNNYLFESTQEALQETEALYRANTSISRARDQLELFEAIEILLHNLHPDMYAGFLKRSDGSHIEMFKSGFEESENDSFNFDHLLALPLDEESGVYIDDVTQTTLGKFELEMAKANNVRAFAAINLHVKDESSGRLIVAYHKPHEFRQGDERFLNAIADSASVVIDNQLLLEQVQSTLQETSVLYQASKALLETSEPEDIIDVIVNYLIEPHINQVFIAMLNTANWTSETAAVEIVASWQAEGGIDMLGVTLTPEQFPAWTQLSSPTVLTIDDIYDEKFGVEPMEQMSIESLDTRSLIIIPLRVPGRAIGAIWLGSREKYQYSDRDLRVYQAFAEQTSLSLEAKRLLEQTEQRARQLQTSAVVSQNVGQILDLNVLLPQVVDLIKEQFSYDHVQVFLMDEDNEWALLTASTGQSGEKLLEVGHRLKRGSESVIGQVTELGQPTIALDTADADVVHQPNPFLPLTRSEMALPMVVKGEIVGALDVQSNQPNAFDDEDVKVLTTLSAQIAVAIDNARLYEEAEKSAQDMTFLFDVTTEAAAADSIAAGLQLVAERLRENVRSDLVALYLPQKYEDYYGNQKTMIELEALSSYVEIETQSIPSIEMGDSESMIGIVASSLQPQIIPNISREIRYTPISPASRSAILMPIVAASEIVGLMLMESHRLSAFATDDLTLMQALAGSLAAIIQNTLLVEQLAETVMQLQEVDRLKSQFLASMSHELRTPLNSIIGFSRVMIKGIDGPLTDMQEQDLTTIYNSGNHLLNLINDILDQAKIEANELNLKFTYFDIKPMIESVRSIAIGMLKEKSLDLHVEIAPNLPQSYGDEFRSRQILLNLVSNAIKFTQEGSVTIRAYLIEGHQGNMIRIDVVDSGIGIAEEDLPTVFEQFRQVDNSLTRTVGGTGLGLPISRSLAELQGGILTVQSTVNVGSTFSVTIPIYEGAQEKLERERDEKRAAQRPSISDSNSGLIRQSDVEKALSLVGKDSNGDQTIADKGDTGELKTPQKKKSHIAPIDPNMTQGIPLITQKRDVILVEENKEMVDQFRRILQREGFEVVTAEHPAYAEAMVGQIRPSMVVLDVNFANGRGWEILKNLKERDDTFDIPIIITTMSDESERSYRLGAHTFIQRPFLPNDLIDAVLAAEKESQRERILIIDDQPESIRLISELLKEHSDFKVFSAQSGDEGISLVARRHPDLIILDLRMPNKDGFAVLDELRGNPETAKIPVLVVTGDLDLSSSEQEALADIRILPKADINQEEYQAFIENIRSYLTSKNRK